MMVQNNHPLIKPPEKPTDPSHARSEQPPGTALTPGDRSVNIMALLMISKTGNFSLKVLAVQAQSGQHVKDRWERMELQHGRMFVGKVVRKKLATRLKVTSL